MGEEKRNVKNPEKMFAGLLDPLGELFRLEEGPDENEEKKKGQRGKEAAGILGNTRTGGRSSPRRMPVHFSLEEIAGSARA